jgi:hypothetical protein
LDIKRIFKITSAILITILIVLIALAYFYYLDLKKTLVAKISDKSTSFIGQKVEIGDLSFNPLSPSSGINLYNITIKNPEGFVSGELLKIKKIYLKIKYSELYRGRFYFKNIIVYSPELSVERDKNGKFNISDKLMHFLKRKSTFKYQVDEFTINTGMIEFNRNRIYRGDNINLHLKNISSESGTKTLLKGGTSYAGGSRIGIEGWAYLKGEPKKFKISIFSEDISLTAFKEIFYRYKINTEQTKIAVNLDIEGDTETGVDLKSKFSIKNAGVLFLRSEIKNILFSTDAFLNMREGSIHIKDFSLYSDEILSLRVNALITDIIKNPVYSSELKINRIDLSALNVREDLAASGIMTSDTIRIKGTLKERLPEISGTVFIRNAALKMDGKKNILKDAFLQIKFQLKDKDIGFKADTNIGKISTNISGNIKRVLQKDRTIEMKIIQPEIKAADIRETFWEIFPDSLLYAGLDGSISSEVKIHYETSGISVNGSLKIKEFMLQGENGEYSIGPVNGMMPIAYSKPTDKQNVLKFPSFESSEFDNLSKYYSQKTSEDDYSRITIGSLNYGFNFLKNINIWIKQEGSVLNIGRFSGNIFGGRLNGSAVVDISDELNYRAGILLEGLSLTKLCEDIEPIKGYISGKVNGIANLKGTGGGISHLIGKADFWTYNTADEKTKISREFLQKIGGPSLKAYLGDRKFDKGVMSLYLQNGFVIFKELEISNRNLLGVTDLSVKVVPLNNRIAIDHLRWTITEAASRAKEK